MAEKQRIEAPGAPGILPHWTSSAKTGVGTARNLISRVWFTLSHGILNEIYYPRLDVACVRDLGLIVTDGRDFFSEEKRHAAHQIEYLEPGVPGFRLVNTCSQGRYRIEKEVIADPRREVVLQKVRFVPLDGRLEDYRLFVLLSPHIGNRGSNNTAWVGDYKGHPMLFAQREGIALCLGSSVGWTHRSVGFVGVSDGWQDLSRHKCLTWTYDSATNGNVALVGEVPLGDGELILGVGFGRLPSEAGHRVLVSFLRPFHLHREDYATAWRDWHRSILPLDASDPRERDLYRASATVLRTHEAKNFPGAIVASLSIPWGASKGDDDLGGYHLVWPRDLVESAGGLLACGAREDAERVLAYLMATQEADGHWPQNMWLDGSPYWESLQMDETAFPILLVDLALRENALVHQSVESYWPMVKRAAAFLVRNGPVTQQDRWEEDGGYSPFTLAVEIAALLAAADLADLCREPAVATYLRETADVWNANVERWTYARGTDLANRLGVDGYYVRIAPPDVADAASPLAGFVPIKNRPPGHSSAAAVEIVSPDALALVRFGLRSPRDPRILDTVKVIDALLKYESPYGPAWYRYNEDGYGEKEDGSPFDGTGLGRPWPLLTGERAHYELAFGRPDEARRLLAVLEAFASETGLLPEQIWDQDDILEHELYKGRPSGSAMPLVWAHSEYVKLRRSLHDGTVFDMPPQPLQRYVVERTGSRFAIWRFNSKTRSIPAGKVLRIETLAPALVHWTTDSWQTEQDTDTRPTGLGLHVADLPTDRLAVGAKFHFTFFWPESNHWEGTNFAVVVVESST